MRAVLDANVFVSAFIARSGVPRQIVDLWREEAFELLISEATEAILDEVARVLRYPRIAALHQLTGSEMRELLSLLRYESLLIAPAESLDVRPDDADNRYIECAVAGGADYLVTGDKRHLLPISAYRGSRIVSPAIFLALLRSERA
jgi:putative PIN family toxin of toxin-antitoxin system